MVSKKVMRLFKFAQKLTMAGSWGKTQELPLQRNVLLKTKLNISVTVFTFSRVSRRYLLQQR